MRFCAGAKINNNYCNWDQLSLGAWRGGVARGTRSKKMSEPKLEEALISANQEPHAAKIRARNLAITATATTTSSDRDLKEASDSETGTRVT